jgi:mannitol-specific phosphotransferase system IIBC component
LLCIFSVFAAFVFSTCFLVVLLDCKCTTKLNEEQYQQHEQQEQQIQKEQQEQQTQQKQGKQQKQQEKQKQLQWKGGNKTRTKLSLCSLGGGAAPSAPCPSPAVSILLFCAFMFGLFGFFIFFALV